MGCRYLTNKAYLYAYILYYISSIGNCVLSRNCQLYLAFNVNRVSDCFLFSFANSIDLNRARQLLFKQFESKCNLNTHTYISSISYVT